MHSNTVSFFHLPTVNAMVKPETTSGVGPTEMGKIEDNDGSAAVDEVADEGKSVASDFLRRNRRQRLPTTHGRGKINSTSIVLVHVGYTMKYFK